MMSFLKKFYKSGKKIIHPLHSSQTFTYSISGKYANFLTRGLVQALQVSILPWTYDVPWKGVLFVLVKNEEVKDKETERSVTDKSLI